MKKLLLLLSLFICIRTSAQSIYQLQQDSIILGKSNGTSSVTVPGKLNLKGLPKGNISIKANGQVIHNDTIYAVAGSGVTSFNGRTGAISPIQADYSAFYPLLSGSYTNPSWIVSLPFSKITGTGVKADTATYSKKYLPYFLTGGQSNMLGHGDSTLSPRITTNAGIAFWNGLVKPANDPVGNAITGSAIPAFVNSWYKITGTTVGIVPAAKGGSSMVAAADVGNGNWSSTGLLRAAMIAKKDSAETAFRALGYTPVFMGILWSQGEADQSAIAASTITTTDYVNGFQNFIDWFKTNLGSNTPLYIIRTARGGSDFYFLQEQIAVSNPFNAFMSYRSTADFQVNGWMQGDNTHYTQAGYNDIGRRLAETILSGRYDNGFARIFDKTGFGGITNPFFSIDAKDKIGINNVQFGYYPDQTNFFGTAYIGSAGGTALSHVTGTDGQENTYGGLGAGNASTIAYGTTGFGTSVFKRLTTGLRNTGTGDAVWEYGIGGNDNTGGGWHAIRGASGNAEFNRVTAIGSGSGSGARTGAADLDLLGYNSGNNITTGTKYMVLGSQISAPTATSSNGFNIKNGIFGTGLSTTGTTISTTGAIGLFTSTPASTLHINTNNLSTDLRISNSNSTTIYSILKDTTLNLEVNKIVGSGNASIQLNPKPVSGTNNAFIQVFRTTNTSGIKRFFVNRGDNTSTADAQISAGGYGVDYNYFAGKTFIGGTTAPDATLNLVASSGAAFTTPLKFKLLGATLVASPENGAFEVNSSGRPFITDVSGVRRAFVLTSSSDTLSNKRMGSSNTYLTPAGTAGTDSIVVKASLGLRAVSAAFYGKATFSSTSSFTGDAVTTSFVINHSLGATPTRIGITATNAASAASFMLGWYVSSRTSTTFTITFLTAPAIGTDNITYTAFP